MGLGKKATAISNELYAIEVGYVQFDSILDARLVDIFVLLKRIWPVDANSTARKAFRSGG